MNLGIFLVLTSIALSLLFGIHGLVRYFYTYDVQIGQYLKLADDASTASCKLEYLQKYAEQIKANITRNQARFIFQRERLTRDTQLRIIQTLIERLRITSEMNPASFEYQQAMAQITSQEFNHTLKDINEVIRSCWFRQSPLIFELWFWWIWPLLSVVGGYIFYKTSD